MKYPRGFMITGNKLSDVIDEYQLEPGTDKGTVHSYVETYDEIFKDRRNEVTTVLEIGLYSGCSLFMWSKYFENAKLYGIDVDLRAFFKDGQERSLKSEYRAELLTYHSVLHANAYSENVPTLLPLMDIVIDDGSHQLEDQKQFIRLYKPILKPHGILIVEDIQTIGHARALLGCFTKRERKNCRIVDLRQVKNRSDDILLVYNK